MTNHTSPDAGQARAATIAGAMYLLTMATSIVEYLLRGSLMVRGDATATAQNIIAARGLLRLAVVVDVVTLAGIIVLIWALHVLLRPVDKSLALLALSFRLVENAIYWVVAITSLVALRLLSGADYLNTFDAEQLHSLARLALSVRGSGYALGFILLGLGSAGFAYLLLKSRYVPRLLAGFGVFASLLMSTCALLGIVLPTIAIQLQWISFGPMFIYEVTLGFWLLLRGASPSAVREALHT